MNIKNNLLDNARVKFSESPNHSGKFGSNLPDTIIIHYTAGATAESAIRTLSNPEVKASAHVVVARDGTITQLVPFDTIAWHAGKSAYGDRVGFNKYAIGIEIVNAGRLVKSGNLYQAWFGKTYTEDEVIQAIHRNETISTYWQRYTEDQITAVYDLCSDLILQYHIKEILGHEEISPGRKIDPGPAFPLDKMRDKLLHADRSDQEDQDTSTYKNPGIVTASKLNMRTGPSTQSPTLSPQLSQNTVVDILDEQSGWYQVDVIIRGWVSKDFIRKG